MRAVSLDPVELVKRLDVEPGPEERPQLSLVPDAIVPIEDNQNRMDLSGERNEELKKGFLRFADFIAYASVGAKSKEPAKVKNPILQYKRVRDFEIDGMAKGLNLKIKI